VHIASDHAHGSSAPAKLGYQVNAGRAGRANNRNFCHDGQTTLPHVRLTKSRSVVSKAAGRRLAEAGCTANEVMSILGHKTLAKAERYTRAADQAKLATAAVLKLEGRSANRIAQTVRPGLGKKSKMEEKSK